MLDLKHLTVLINDRILIENLCLHINKGDKLAIIGEEGNGKSTLFKIIANQNNYADFCGEIHSFHNTIGFLQQELIVDENKIVKDYLFQDEMDFYFHINELYTLFSSLQLDDTILDKKIFILSGGEKVKVQLLKLLLKDPDILLLDEPTNDLDIPTLEWLEHFIQECSKPVLFISHDETLLQRCANRILHIEQLNKQTKCKHTIYNGAYSNYIKERIRKRTKDIQIANKEKAEYIKKKERLNNIQNAVHDALNDTVRNPGKAALLKKKMSNVKAMEKRFEKESYARVDSIEEEINLFFEPVSLPSRKEILNLHLAQLKVEDRILASPVHLEVYGPSHIVICGSNGCGKTTLFKLIYEQLKHRKDIRCGYMPQSYEILPEKRTPIEFLCPSMKNEEITIARKRLGNLNFTRAEMTAPIPQLSKGSKAKLILLYLILNQYDVLLLDEPTRNVSPLSNPVIRKALREFQGCIISISHDRKYIEEVCDIVYKMDQDGLHLEDDERSLT